MKRVLLLILALMLLFSGCSFNGAGKTASSTAITVNMPKDDTVNGYRKSGENPSASDGMPDSISADNITVGTESTTQQSPAKSNAYCGNKNSKVFHKSNCGSVSTMKNENKVFFNNRDEFIKNGYKPCSRCSP